MTKPVELSTRIDYSVAWVRGKVDLTPVVGVVLGSGLGPFAERLTDATSIPYSEIPGFPVSRVAGHAGRLVVGELPAPDGPVAVAALQGRVHAYEGWPAAEVAFGTRVLCSLGIRSLLVTNAAGAVNPAYRAGDLVRIVDHLNLTGLNPLVGPADERLGPRFPDLSEAYDRPLGELLEASARETGIELKTGVYAGVLGPSYETPAEIRMLRLLGADLVGMSTVHEVIAARHQNVRVAGISVVTNLAAGLAAERLTHEEVQTQAGRASERLVRLLSAYLPRAAR
jgi:purine-nucleoside phosphorylase